MATNTYVALATQTLSGTSVTFSSIPSTYTDLVLVHNGLATADGNAINLTFNGDTASNYSRTFMYGDGTSAVSGRSSSQTSFQASSIYTNPTPIIYQINNYANTTTYKTILSRTSAVDTGSLVVANVGLWRSTAAITSITLTSDWTSGTASLYGILAEGVNIAKALGGQVTYDANYVYHTFASSGTFTPSLTLSCDVLAVAGGGGGGVYTGGGGGGGGLVYSTGLSIATAQTITIGGGGAGSATNSTRGTNGSDTVFGATYTCAGGGGGGSWGNATSRNGLSGGSGGGAAEYSGAGTVGTSTQTSYSGLGFGTSGGTMSYGANGGGGGGAGGAGGASSNGFGGNGGIGKTYSISGTSTGYAGGGGGALNDLTETGQGTASYGGGAAKYLTNGVSGTAFTGGGGGAAATSTHLTAGSGGSGIVIIRYAR